MKSDRTVQRELRKLRRECIEGQPNPVLTHVALAMDMAVRWAREDVRGWPSLADEARLVVRMIQTDTGRIRAATSVPVPRSAASSQSRRSAGRSVPGRTVGTQRGRAAGSRA